MTLILGSQTMSKYSIESGLTRLGTVVDPLFLATIFPAVYKAAIRYQVDAIGAVAQAAHETAFGKFPNRIDKRWRNTCGLKKRDFTMVPGYDGPGGGDLPLCHETFGSWDIGARAHVQHLVGYAGGFIDIDELIDPRWDWIDRNVRPAVHFADLDRWATATGYGAKLEAMIARIRSANSL